MLKETDKLLDPMTIYISFVTALYLLFTKKDYLKYKNQDIAQLLSDFFFTFFAVFLTRTAILLIEMGRKNKKQKQK